MAGIGLEFDPTSEDASNVALNINDGTKFKAISFNAPTPDRDVNWASSADTEGSLPANLRYQNRTITIEVRVYGSSAANLNEELGKLEQKIGRINDPAEPTTLKWTGPSSTTCIFDILEGAADYQIDNSALANKRTVVTITLTAKPFWRSGTEVEGSAHKEATLPFIIGVDESIPGDVPALGRLVVTEEQGQDQWTLIWGTQSHNYSSSENAELFYQAESRTPLGGEKKAGPSGASGSGENTIFCGSLIPAYQAVMSTQKASAGAHLSHVGTYRVFARVQRPTTNTGAVSVRLSWAQGDFLRYTTNTEKTYAADELEGVWTLIDLGLVRIQKVTAGTQRWEGRIEAKSTAYSDDIYIDCLALFPVDEGYGSLKVEPSTAAPSTLSAHDEFEQTEGNLSGKSLPLGGTWSGAGDAVDFKVISASKVAQRTEVSDADLNTGRYGIAGSTSYTGTKVGAIVGSTFPIPASMRLGVMARYSSTENWLMAVVTTSGGHWVLGVIKRVAGTVTTLAQTQPALQTTGYEVFLSVLPSGIWEAYLGINGVKVTSVLSGQDSALATGGALAEGKPGIYDAWLAPDANTRTVDNFWVFTGTSGDAAVYASKKAEIRWDRYQREDSGGTLWVPRSDYKGSYFKPPPARREARKVRTIIKLSRYNIDSMQDAAIDDGSFKLTWQARGLVLPES